MKIQQFVKILRIYISIRMEILSKQKFIAVEKDGIQKKMVLNQEEIAVIIHFLLWETIMLKQIEINLLINFFET